MGNNPHSYSRHSLSQEASKPVKMQLNLHPVKYANSKGPGSTSKGPESPLKNITSRTTALGLQILNVNSSLSEGRQKVERLAITGS